LSVAVARTIPHTVFKENDMAMKARRKARSAKAAKAKRKPAAKKAKKTRKAAQAKKKTPAKRAVAKKAKRPAAKKAKKAKRKTKDVIGEGNYTAARNFRKAETGFIDRNRATIARKAKEAEAAIDGPQGAELEQARVETAARGEE
jgi:hypothetical protein